ncbi:MAG: hypothetical protein QXR60_03245, partial [Candidatus Nanoarchaeia archaeon]
QIDTSSAVQFPVNTTNSKPSPYDRVKESQIHVYDDKVVIDMAEVQWASYADTHSMEPVLKAGANGLELIPQSDSDIYVGDIVAYEASWSDGLVVHRVIEKGRDEFGTYFILKGDNNSSVDPGKVRFSDIKYVLIGVIY